MKMIKTYKLLPQLTINPLEFKTGDYALQIPNDSTYIKVNEYLVKRNRTCAWELKFRIQLNITRVKNRITTRRIINEIDKARIHS